MHFIATGSFLTRHRVIWAAHHFKAAGRMQELEIADFGRIIIPENYSWLYHLRFIVHQTLNFRIGDYYSGFHPLAGMAASALMLFWLVRPAYRQDNEVFAAAPSGAYVLSKKFVITAVLAIYCFLEFGCTDLFLQRTAPYLSYQMIFKEGDTIKTLIYLAFPAAAAVAFGLEGLWTKPRGRAVSIGIVMILAVSGLYCSHQGRSILRSGTRELESAAAYFEAERAQGPIPVYTDRTGAFFFRYFSNNRLKDDLYDWQGPLVPANNRRLFVTAGGKRSLDIKNDFLKSEFAAFQGASHCKYELKKSFEAEAFNKKDPLKLFEITNCGTGS